MEPTWQSPCGTVRLYQADCLDVLRNLPSVGAVVTDPPWGINYKSTHNSNHAPGQWAAWVRDENFDGIAGDDQPFDPSPWLALQVPTVLFGGNYFSSRLPDSRCWVCWDKRDGIGQNDFADCEYAWTNFDRPSRIFRHVWSGLIRAGEENVSKSPKWHPHQKPVALMSWLLEYGKIEGTVLDPYMGSGSTGVAAVRKWLPFIGIESDAQHFETAKRRIAEALDAGPLFSQMECA